MIKAAAFIVKQVVKVAKNAAVKAANEGAGKPFPSIAVEGVCTLTDDAIDALYRAIMGLPEQERRQAVQDIAEATPEQLSGTVNAEVEAEVGDASPAVREDVREAATAIAAQLRSNAQTLLTAPDARGVSVLKPGVTLNSREDIRRLVETFPGSLHTGDLVGNRFSIVRTLAKGGMGVVYLADDQHLSERVALKTIRPELSVSPQVRSRFLEEAKLARRLSHPNIIRVHDAAMDESRKLLFLSMEAIDGESLDDWIRRRPQGCTPAEFRIIAPQVCAAVEYAHRRGVLHLDLKPSNVMVSTDLSSVWVLDFGLGQALAAGRADATSLGGTAYSMSPEQLKGDKVDVRADVYSLAVLFFHMLTGEIPVAGMGTAADERHGVPTEWSDAIAKAMKRRVEERWTSVHDFGGALRDPPSSPRPAPKSREEAREPSDASANPAETDFSKSGRGQKPEHPEPEWFAAMGRPGGEWRGWHRFFTGSGPQDLATLVPGCTLDQQTVVGIWKSGGKGMNNTKLVKEVVARMEAVADLGNANAQFNLGKMYEYGRGVVARNDAKAIEWFQKSAEQGDAEAQRHLGNMHASGRGVPKDDAKAVEWYRQSAAQSNAGALFNLGDMLERGKGVSKSLTEAIRLYKLAAAQGDQVAAARLKALKPNG